MRKYRLVKCYPGSPELGIEVEKQAKTQTYYHIYNDRKFGVLTEHVENNSEYWEEILEDFYYLVFTEDETSFNAWEPIRVGAVKCDTDTKKYFSTKEGARDFIIQHKPCLSFNEVRGLVGHSFFGSTSHQRLFELAKSRICQ